jgi:hypothetical protein
MTGSPDPFQRGISKEQYEYLLNPIRSTRIATRRQGGKELSYLEAWDVKAHLTRIFGFGNWDSEMLEYRHVTDRTYTKDGKDMVEVVYSARMQLTVRDQWGQHLCRHTESAVGSTSGPINLLGEHHDNALKTAASDGLKRCAINLGTQFGLSLYASTKVDVVRMTLVTPPGWQKTDPSAEARAALEHSVGAKDIPSADGDPLADAGEDREAMQDHPDAIAGNPNEHGSH